MKRFTKADVEQHSGGYGRRMRPAVNVKVYDNISGYVDKIVSEFRCTEAVAQRALDMAWEASREVFWEDAEGVARDIWGSVAKVYSEGRSGGWLIVEHGPADDIEGWDAVALAKWRKLVRWCEREIHYRMSYEVLRDDISANRWAEPGAEPFNFFQRPDGSSECLVDLKAKGQALGLGPVIRP